MAKSKEVTPNYVNRVIEQVIESTHIAPFNPENKTIDFKIDDVVKCSYMQGLFKVADIFTEEILIYPVDLLGEYERVKPQFLEKIETSPETMKVLFDV